MVHKWCINGGYYPHFLLIYYFYFSVKGYKYFKGLISLYTLEHLKWHDLAQKKFKVWSSLTCVHFGYYLLGEVA